MVVMTATGKDIEARCGKCGEVWHVVVAMVGDAIAKVQCKECHAYHKYRPIAGATTKAASARRKSASRSRKPAGPKKRPKSPTAT